ncbi:MAG: NUDIX hydrolase [Candidatus Coatesbacteria bacterium]
MKPWEKTGQEVVYDGRLKVVKKTFRRPDGRLATFEVRDTLDVVCILAVTTEGRILFARQFRPGLEEVMLDLPGGFMDSGETPEQSARRELREETGYEAGEIRFLAANPVSAYANNRRHNFLATGCRKVGAPQNQDQEECEVVELSLDEFKARLRGGNLTDIGSGFLGLDALKLL